MSKVLEDEHEAKVYMGKLQAVLPQGGNEAVPVAIITSGFESQIWDSVKYN